MFMGEVSIVNTNAQKRLSFFLLHFTTVFYVMTLSSSIKIAAIYKRYYYKNFSRVTNSADLSNTDNFLQGL